MAKQISKCLIPHRLSLPKAGEGERTNLTLKPSLLLLNLLHLQGLLLLEERILVDTKLQLQLKVMQNEWSSQSNKPCIQRSTTVNVYLLKLMMKSFMIATKETATAWSKSAPLVRAQLPINFFGETF